MFLKHILYHDHSQKKGDNQIRSIVLILLKKSALKPSTTFLTASRVDQSAISKSPVEERFSYQVIDHGPEPRGEERST